MRFDWGSLFSWVFFCCHSLREKTIKLLQRHGKKTGEFGPLPRRFPLSLRNVWLPYRKIPLSLYDILGVFFSTWSLVRIAKCFWTKEMYREKTFLFPGMSWFFLQLKEIPTPPMDVMVHNLEQDKRFFKSYSLTSTNVTGLCGILLLLRLLNTTEKYYTRKWGRQKWPDWYLWYHFQVISNRRLRFGGLNLGNIKKLQSILDLYCFVILFCCFGWFTLLTRQIGPCKSLARPFSI